MSEISTEILSCPKCSSKNVVPMTYPVEKLGFSCLICSKDIWIKQADMSSTLRRDLFKGRTR